MWLIKKIIKIYLKKENENLVKILSEILKDKKLTFLDIGASGGIPKRWEFVEKFLIKILVEPDEKSSKELINSGNFIIDKVLFSEPDKNIDFYHTQKQTCSSLLKPNFDYLKKFSDSERFKIENNLKFKTSTLDLELNDKFRPDFMKIDTEGSELIILDGSQKTLKKLLGLEIEVSFFKLRENQPIYEDVVNYLSKYNFEFIDFLSMIRWERDKFRFTGQPHLSDLLFLISPNKIIEDYNKGKISEDIVLKYIIILVVYLRVDFLRVLSLDNKIKNNFNYIEKILYLVEEKVKKINQIDNISYLLKSKIYNTI